MSTIILFLGVVAVLAIGLVAEGLAGLRHCIGPWSDDANEYDDAWRKQRQHQHQRQRSAGPGLRVPRSFQKRRDFDPEHSLMRRASDNTGGEAG